MIELPSNIWYGDTPLIFEPPESWDVSVFRMAGDSLGEVGKEEIIRALREPVGQKALSSLAEESKEAVIVFDDMTRPTRLEEISRAVIGELKRGGVPDEKITFICANGAHGTYDRDDFRQETG